MNNLFRIFKNRIDVSLFDDIKKTVYDYSETDFCRFSDSEYKGCFPSKNNSIENYYPGLMSKIKDSMFGDCSANFLKDGKFEIYFVKGAKAPPNLTMLKHKDLVRLHAINMCIYGADGAEIGFYKSKSGSRARILDDSDAELIATAPIVNDEIMLLNVQEYHAITDQHMQSGKDMFILSYDWNPAVHCYRWDKLVKILEDENLI